MLFIWFVAIRMVQVDSLMTLTRIQQMLLCQSHQRVIESIDSVKMDN